MKINLVLLLCLFLFGCGEIDKKGLKTEVVIAGCDVEFLSTPGHNLARSLGRNGDTRVCVNYDVKVNGVSAIVGLFTQACKAGMTTEIIVLEDR